MDTMKCAICNAPAFQTFTWIAAKPIAQESRRAGTIVETTTTYTNFHRVRIDVCDRCFRSERRRMQRHRLMVIAVAMISIAVGGTILNSISGNDRLEIVAVIIGVVLAAAFWLATGSVFKFFASILKHGAFSEIPIILSSTLQKRLQPGEAYWTEAQFDAVCRSNKWPPSSRLLESE